MLSRLPYSCSVRAVLALAIAGMLGFAPAACIAQCPTYTTSVGGTVQPTQITEASGLAASRRTPGFFFTHNDNTNDQRVFALTPTGELRGTFSIVSSSNVRDPEDIAIGPGPMSGESYLYLADIGDNNNVRTDIAVYRTLEPSVPATGSPVVADLQASKIALAYPDGPRDAETLFVDTNGDLYVVAKRLTPGKVYRAAYPQSTTSVNMLEHVGQLPWGQTWPVGGDMAADGSAIIIRGYFNISIWTRPFGANVGDVLSSQGCPVGLVFEPQGEAVCFTSGSLDYATLSEGVNEPINLFHRQPPVPNIADFVDALLETPDDAAAIAAYDYNQDEKLDAHDIPALVDLLLGS